MVFLEIPRNLGFYLKNVDVDGDKHLVLCHSNKSILLTWHRSQQIKQIHFLIESLFDSVDGEELQLKELDHHENGKELQLSEFYEKLKEVHETDDLETGIPSDVQHSSLRPLLRDYQKKGIKWMLSRELRDEPATSRYITLRSKFNASQLLDYDPLNQWIFEHDHHTGSIPRGGLLTDEMGLGKTVEVLGLILMNPKKSGTKRTAVALANEEDDVKRKAVIRCICHKNEKKNSKKTDLIVCRNCVTSQHLKCVFKKDILRCDDSLYLCPLCWKSENRIIDSKTTLIVTPSSIKSQWKDEIAKHIGDKSFKTLMYDGISNGWVGPNELTQYDAIITDFNTLSKELYFFDVNASDRNLRNGKKFEYPPSPLTYLNWWRVVLDEAQLVENKNNRPSLMVKELRAEHRWASTGTPIEKESISCLYGLIFFINYEPYTDEAYFIHICNQYRRGKYEEMIKILSKVMWRTCKKDVEDQINIPKQTEVMHTIDMSDLQKYYYRQAHLITKQHFMENVQDFLFRHAGIGRNERKFGGFVDRIDLSLKDKLLYQLNNATLSIFLDPLRNLRQDCTIPSIFHKTNDQTRVKKVLKPEELHEHLVSKTSIESKSQLRTICSSFNGMAALKLAEEKYDEAVNLYRQIIKLGDQHKGVVSVDSMILIHVYNSLIDIARLSGDTNLTNSIDDFNVKMKKLEWKYVSNFYDKVKNIAKDLEQHKTEYRRAMKDFTDFEGYWWIEILEDAFRSNDETQRLMDVINTEVFSSINSANAPQHVEQVRTFHGIELIVSQWTSKIKTLSKDVQKRFAAFEFIIYDLDATRTVETDKKIEEIAKQALECHLNLFENADSDDDVPMLPKKSKKLCRLCELKMKLNEYECVLFNKTLVDEQAEGTWHSRFEEKLLQSLFKYAKRATFRDGIILVGNTFFKYLEALKEKFRAQSSLWVEVNYTVSAFDEINMCKMRMQVVNSPEQITEEDARFKLKILRCEIPEQLQIFVGQKAEAEIGFVRLNGRLKYLEHLKETNQPKICAICTNNPKERYFVTICGHSICDECFLMMIKNRNKTINCPVCRTHQETREVLAVNTESTSNEPISGSYSPKIDQIIRTILSLKRKDSDVKIILFTHWDSIINAIIPALNANGINYRSSTNSKFDKQVQEFKDYSKEVTCLLLNLKFGGKGLNLIEATHVFLIEPILNADDEFQAIGRVHRIGQTRETFVHRFITKDTIEETIYCKITREREKWTLKHFTIRDLEELFDVENDDVDFDD